MSPPLLTAATAAALSKETNSPEMLHSIIFSRQFQDVSLRKSWAIKVSRAGLYGVWLKASEKRDKP